MFVFILDLAPPAAAAPMPIPHICDGPGLDLDGDGALERFDTVPDSRGTGGATYDVYVGTRKVGQIAGCWFRRGKQQSHGLWDIIGIWRGGARISYVTRYRFNGRRYRGVSIPNSSE